MIGTFRLPITTTSGYTGFITEWLASGDTAARTIGLPLVSGQVYDAIVYWGDGSSSVIKTYNDANSSHTYSTSGTYQINIVGTCDGWSFNNAGDKLKIRKVINFNGPHFNGFKYLTNGFYGCTNLSTIANPIKANGLGCTSFQNLFSNCNILSNIPTDLFRYHTENLSFRSTFYNCYALTTTGVDTFKYNTKVTTFQQVFDNESGTASLSAITTDLFRYNTLATNFLIAFRKTKVVSLPVDLFRYNTEATDFRYIFTVCAQLSAITSDLFQYNTKVTSFSNAFSNCTALTNVPTDFFRYNVASNAFDQVFDGCQVLTTVSNDLFRYNTGVTTFAYCFRNCYKMQQNATIFYQTGVTNRFTNQSVNFTDCFSRGSFTGTQGTAPDLWNQNYGTGTPTTTACFGGAGNSLTSLTNYGSIPAGYK